MRARPPAGRPIGAPTGDGGDRYAAGRGSSAGMVRVSTFQALPGHMTGLVAVANDNARDARKAAGCLSADVCADPGGQGIVLVISRWESESALRAFLAWHEQTAHETLSSHATGKPRSVHYPAITPI